MALCERTFERLADFGLEFVFGGLGTGGDGRGCEIGGERGAGGGWGCVAEMERVLGSVGFI